MRYCKHCGNQVSDTATFCGKCGAQLTPQGAGNSGQMRSFWASNRVSPVTNNNILRKIEGGLMLAVMTGGLLLPVMKTGAAFKDAGLAGFSLSVNMASLLSSLSQLQTILTASSSYLTNITRQLSQYNINLDFNGLGIWLTLLAILAIIALVGTFITAARCLESTSKSTLITSWLLVPFSLCTLIVMLGTAGKLNGAVANLAVAAGNTSVQSTEVLHVTIWPWLVLIGAIACGVIELIHRGIVNPSQIQQLGRPGGIR